VLNILKKLIAYQRLLLNSNPPIDINSQNPLNVLFYVFAFAMLVFINISLFFGDTASSDTFIPFTFPIITIWMLNRILHGDHRLFETVPVSRKYTALNIFLLPIVMIFILFILVYISAAVLISIIIGFVSLTNPQGSSQLPPDSALQQIVDTTNGNLLMLCVLIIIIFVGTTIALIKRKKLRFLSFVVFTALGYGLLLLLKINMPIYPATGKIEFIESFSIMPQSNAILIIVAIATIIISIISVYLGSKHYIGKSASMNHS